MQANSKRRFINVNFTMSYEEYDAGSIMPEYHLHNDYEIYILERGERIVSVDTAGTATSHTTVTPHIAAACLNSSAVETGPLEVCTVAGDSVLFSREEPHKSRGTGGFSGICIHFSERFLRKYFTEVSIAKYMELFTLRKIHLSEKQVSELKKMSDSFLPDTKTNFLRLARVFEILFDAAALDNKDSRQYNSPDGKTSLPIRNRITPGPASSTKKAQLFTYVDENYAYIQNLTELADMFAISESYLYKMFQTEFQMSPKTYINRLKIQNVCNRLKYSDATIRSVAEDHGFESYEHFCRLFKKEMGYTPTEYRNSHLT